MILGLFRAIQLQGCSPEGATLFLNKVYLLYLRRIYLGAVTLSTTLSQASSKRYRIFLNEQLFFRIQKFPCRSVFKSDLPVHAHSIVSRFTLEKLWKKKKTNKPITVHPYCQRFLPFFYFPHEMRFCFCNRLQFASPNVSEGEGLVEL